MSDGYSRGQKKKVACPCCKFLTIEAKGWYEICPVCRWEDSGQGDIGEPNHVTPTEARLNFATFGASEERRRSRVRAALPDEYPES
ncbi:CPCC family cysteine-rich protein [Streptomyces cucumeris]|uniref:CPCC family cysteine-rich protein n=1 Tax=Streptomyces cucumeris TaxID=2962890 RepID=UPI003D746262